MEAAARAAVRATRIFLCTLACLHRISTLELEYGPDFPGAPHTVVIDEAGATPESYVPQVLQTGAENLVLLGDHRQLPPLVLTLDFAEVEAKRVNRSLMERALAQVPESEVHMLTVQYRMPTAICELVSGLFYGGRVFTDPARRPKAAPEEADGGLVASADVPLRWLAVEHEEAVLGTSKQNLGEAAVVVAWLWRLLPLAKRRGETVRCITFYSAQRDLIRSALEDEEDRACVLSVDATQGSEADHVVLSTVRSNDRGEVGFCGDRRRICVAISRARSTLTIVGDPSCMCTGPWARVVDAAELQEAEPDPEALEALGGPLAPLPPLPPLASLPAQQAPQAPQAPLAPSAPLAPLAQGLDGHGRGVEAAAARHASTGLGAWRQVAAEPATPASRQTGFGAWRQVAAEASGVAVELPRARLGRPAGDGAGIGGWRRVAAERAPSPVADARPQKVRPPSAATARAPTRAVPTRGTQPSRAAAGQTVDVMPPRPALVALRPAKKVEPCHFFAAGRCTRGVDCSFSHDFKPGDKAVAVQLREAALPCQFHAMGRCDRGQDCTFSHSFRPGDPAVATLLRRGAEPCHFFAKGMCKKGTACSFSHG